jgi:glycosyltransferase involved in cell wall biosynthesis
MKKIIVMVGSAVGGGSLRFAVNVAEWFSKNKNYDFTLVTQEPVQGEYSINPVVKRECILRNSYLRDVITIRKYLKKENIDVSISIGIYHNLINCLAGIGLKTKTIISERNAPKQDLLSKKTKLLRFLIFRFADGYVFQTKGAKEYYSRKIQQHSIVIHNPIKDNLPYRSEVHRKEIIASGRLMPQKNYPLMLKAFAKIHRKYPQYVLRVFGLGEHLDEYKKLALSLGIETSVIFEGFVNEGYYDKVKDSDIFVMSSDFEGMSNSLQEMMAMGFPVVCTDCPAGGPRELIEDYKNGRLVPLNDVKAFTNAIAEYIENPTLKEKCAREATKIRETHSLDIIMKKWVEYLEFISR